MQDYQDVIAAARNLAKLHLHEGQRLNSAQVDYDRSFTEDEVIEVLANCYAQGQRLPALERNRAGHYRLVSR